jgi:NAD(P)H-quinone oxidoreductase subunit H
LVKKKKRIASHLLRLGPFIAYIGTQTPFFYIFREGELIYDLFDDMTGRLQKMTDKILFLILYKSKPD